MPLPSATPNGKGANSNSSVLKSGSKSAIKGSSSSSSSSAVHANEGEGSEAGNKKIRRVRAKAKPLLSGTEISANEQAGECQQN